MNWRLGYDLALEHVFEHESNIQDAFIELNQAEGEYQEELEPVNRRLREIEALKERITDEGMSQSIATRIGDIADNENIHEEYGVTLESFSKYPSRTNMKVALEELDDQHKNVLIGAGAVIGLAVIAKIIHIIWKFFKKDDSDGSKSSGDDIKNQREDFARKKNRLDEVQRELANATKNHDELKELYEEMERELTSTKSNMSKYLDDHWNGLMNAILISTGSKFHTGVIKVFSDFPNYTLAVNKAIDSANKLNNGLRVWLRDGNAAEEVGALYDDIVKNMPPEHMRKNLSDIQGLIDMANDLKQQKETINEHTIANISNDLSTNSGLSFLMQLENFKPSENSSLASKNGGGRAGETADSISQQLKDLANEKVEVPKEVADKINDFVKYYVDGTKNYAKTLYLFQTIKAAYDTFMAVLRKRDIDARGGVFKRIIEKLFKNGKTAEEMRRMPGGEVLQKFLQDIKDGKLALNNNGV